MAIYILEYCDTWHSMDEIAQFANRDKNYIRNKVLPKLAEKLEKERQTLAQILCAMMRKGDCAL